MLSLILRQEPYNKKDKRRGEKILEKIDTFPSQMKERKFNLIIKMSRITLIV